MISQRIFSALKKNIPTQGFKANLTKMLLANIINSGSVFLLTLFLVRALTPQEFGWIGKGLAMAFILSKFSDAGLSFTILRFSAKYPDKRASYLGLLYAIALFSAGILLILTLLPTGHLISGLIIGEQDRTLFLFIIFTALSLSLHAGVRADLQSQEDYNTLLLYNILLATCRIGFGCYAYLATESIITKVSGLSSLYILPIFTGILFFGWRIPRYLQHTIKQGQAILSVVKELAGYAPWVWISGTLYITAVRAPVIIFGQLGRDSDVAVYTAALSFVAIISLLNDAIRGVIIPKCSTFVNKQEYNDYVTKYDNSYPKLFFVMGAAITLFGILTIPLLPDSYFPTTILVFYSLGFSLLLVTIVGLLTSIIHALGTPRLEAIVNFIRFFLIYTGNITLIYVCNMGIVGITIFNGIILVGGEFLLGKIVRRRIHAIL